MPQILAITSRKRGFIWWDSFAVLKVNIDARPLLQLFVIALCLVSQPLNRKKILHLSLLLKTNSWKSFLFFANDR